MPRSANTPVKQPIFREPTFNELVPTLDPKLFSQAHPSDAQLYKQIGDLLKKDVVSFDTARGNPGDLYACKTPWARKARTPSRRSKRRLKSHSMPSATRTPPTSASMAAS